MELTVLTSNERAKNLYRKLGFIEEGVRRGSMLLDGDYVDELYMAKFL